MYARLLDFPRTNWKHVPSLVCLQLIYIYGKFIASDISGEKVDLADTKITSEKQMHDARTEMEISHVKLDKGRVEHVLALVLKQFNNKVSWIQKDHAWTPFVGIDRKKLHGSLNNLMIA